jgi:hypothetical protein
VYYDENQILLKPQLQLCAIAADGEHNLDKGQPQIGFVSRHRTSMSLTTQPRFLFGRTSLIIERST